MPFEIPGTTAFDLITEGDLTVVANEMKSNAEAMVDQADKDLKDAMTAELCAADVAAEAEAAAAQIVHGTNQEAEARLEAAAKKLKLAQGALEAARVSKEIADRQHDELLQDAAALLEVARMRAEQAEEYRQAAAGHYHELDAQVNKGLSLIFETNEELFEAAALHRQAEEAQAKVSQAENEVRRRESQLQTQEGVLQAKEAELRLQEAKLDATKAKDMAEKADARKAKASERKWLKFARRCEEARIEAGKQERIADLMRRKAEEDALLAKRESLGAQLENMNLQEDLQDKSAQVEALQGQLKAADAHRCKAIAGRTKTRCMKNAQPNSLACFYPSHKRQVELQQKDSEAPN